MKHYLFLFLASTIGFSSCNKEEEAPQLVNEWHLIEMLADPGDGSGTFEPVTSAKTVSFFEDGTISSNGSLCQMGIESGTASSGTYSTTDSTIIVDNCGFSPPYPLSFEMEGPNLILNYPCIEPCREKYVVRTNQDHLTE